MQPFQSEEIIERGITSIAAALNQRPPSDATINVWKALFSNENARVLAMCFRRLVEESDRFPPPRRMRGLLAEFKPRGIPALTHTAGFDAAGRPCWFWSDEPTAPAYRPQDCQEGLEYLARMRKLCASNTPRGSKEEKSRRAELQRQKVEILSAQKRVREPGDDG
jgi:hypothetical protein